MKKQLKPAFTSLLTNSARLRNKIGAELDVHPDTIKRRAIANSEKLTTDFFLASFKKHANIGDGVEMLELVGEEVAA